MFAPPTLAPFTLLHSLASSIRSILPGDGVTCINQCKSAVIFRLRRRNCQNNCKTTVHFWRNRCFSQNCRKITVLLQLNSRFKSKFQKITALLQLACPLYQQQPPSPIKTTKKPVGTPPNRFNLSYFALPPPAANRGKRAPGTDQRLGNRGTPYTPARAATRSLRPISRRGSGYFSAYAPYR